MKICLFDPGLEKNNGTPSANLGDLIIQEAVNREIQSLFGNCEILRIATHTYPTQEHIDIARSCSLIFVGGTNLLGSRMREYKQWKISFKQKMQIGRAVLLGVGWKSYEEAPDFYTSLSLKAVLSNRLLHSVRDNYTKMQLESAGIKNVINTGCPTMWTLRHIKYHEIPQDKSENVLVMLTDYSKEPELDRRLLELAISKYKKVFIWPQGRSDLNYVCNLLSVIDIPALVLGKSFKNHLWTCISDERFPVIILEHSINGLENLLKSDISFDYIGTRLHGGIKCLHSKRRSLIIEIDNRAKEIASETKLSTVTREDFEGISRWIHEPYNLKIQIDIDSINAWKSQFKQFISQVA